jgi:hypothetical protein
MEHYLIVHGPEQVSKGLANRIVIVNDMNKNWRRHFQLLADAVVDWGSGRVKVNVTP